MVDTTVFSTTLTTNDTGDGDYTIRSVFPVTGMPDAQFLVLTVDFSSASGARYVSGLPSINGTPGVGALEAYASAYNSYNRATELGNSVQGIIQNVSSVKIRGSGDTRQICVTLQASSVTSTNYDNVSIGIWNGTNSPNSPFQGSTTATPVELKFGGVSNLSLAAGTSQDSDWMPFAENYSIGVYGPHQVYNASGGWQGYTFVQVLDGSILRNANGNEVRIGVFFLAANAGDTMVAYVGQAATTGNEYSFRPGPAPGPVRFTWNSNNTLTHDGVTTYFVSDWVTLPEAYDKTKKYAIAFQFAGTGTGIRTNTLITSGAQNYQNVGADAATVTKSGYAPFSTGNPTLVEIFEVKTASSTDVRANFDLLNGVAGLKTDTANSSSIVPVGNDWYRCSVTFIPTTANSNVSLLHCDSNSLTPDYAGTGTSYWAWGAQVESGNVATEYITTTSAPVTAGITSIVSGSGTASTTVADAGTLQSQTSTLVAAGLSKSIGTGVLTSTNCTAAGSGVSRSVSTSAALVASNSTIVSAGISQSVSTLAALAASVSTLSSVGVSRSVSTLGVLNAQSSTQLGSGVSASIGTGILIDAGSVLVGSGTAAFPAATGTGVLIAASAVLIGIDINTEYLYPDADAAIGGWTDQAGGTTNLYQAVDEATANDTDYVQSSFNPTNDIIRFRMSDPTAGVGIPFDVSYRYGISGVGPGCTITARLKQGNTVIKSWAHTDGALALKTVSQSLSAGELATITNFSDLFVEFEAGP
jgi:hypothetical protein